MSKNKSSSNSDNEADRKRASSRGIIPRAKIKTVKMTLVIVFATTGIKWISLCKGAYSNDSIALGNLAIRSAFAISL
ncbi:hypothetical protein CEXT_116071 [Caerostris extrusa]|uniref:Uncharacterized protein n=1 Tax=Caerostris extrusa TaxID=172846 RepID=A0AAV4N1C0_CAEEX|nr:hypothetical protein CEXT_116071 [Caerostris extrusa]